MSFELSNRIVTVDASDLSLETIKGVVVGITERTLALRLLVPITLPSGEVASHLVATIRDRGKTLNEIANCQQVSCGITLVPEDRFNPTNPCDLSWWRGGGAAIGDVAATLN